MTIFTKSWIRPCYRRMPEEEDHRVIKVLFKCLGKLYEHTRMDRDEYITILWKNINASKSDCKIVIYK